MTETGMALSNPYNGRREPGTVGQPLPGVDVRIVASKAEDEERRSGSRASELSSSDDERLSDEDVARQWRHRDVDTSGEIRVKGPCLFKEYWQQPEITESSFDEKGYFRTGEIYARAA
jgi:malonyl-CoA/methylmalonyl-CoA synthetase